MRPEIVRGMPADEYHATDGYGSTAIGAVAKWSVAHYLADRAKPRSESMATGSLSHIMLLEPETAAEQLTVAPQCQCVAATSKGSQCTRQSIVGATRCRQHGGEADAEQWRASLDPGALIVTDEELAAATERALRVRDNVRRLKPPFCGLLDGGDREVSIFAEAILTDDGAHGYVIDNGGISEPAGPRVAVHARVDIMHPRLAVDLKGVSRRQSLTRWGWRSHMREYSYAVQAALYSDIVAAATGEPHDWGWLVHEQAAPYGVRVFAVDATMMDHGRHLVGCGLERWHAYEQSGDEWHGWPDGLEFIEAD